MTFQGLLLSSTFLTAALLVNPAWGVPSLNLGDTFDPIKAKIAAGQRVNIVTMGDSITASNFGWQPAFTSLMQTAYGNAGPGYVYSHTGDTGADWTYSDAVGFDPAPHQAIDGYWVSNPGTAANTTTDRYMTPGLAQFHQQFVSQPGGGTVIAKIVNGGQIVSTHEFSTASAVAGVQSWSYSGVVAEGVEYYAKGDGPVTLLGYTQSSTAPGVTVHNLAHGGWGINNYLQRDATFDEQMKLLTPDLITLWVGQNDGANNPDYSDYRDRIQQEVDRLKATSPGAKILMIGSYDSNSTKFIGINGAIGDVAAANGLGFINLYETLGSFDQLTQQGIIGDGVHLSQEGGQYVGNYLFQVFQTDTVSNNVPEPTSGLLLLVGGAILLRRGRRAKTALGNRLHRQE